MCVGSDGPGRCSGKEGEDAEDDEDDVRSDILTKIGGIESCQSESGSSEVGGVARDPNGSSGRKGDGWPEMKGEFAVERL